MKILVFAKPGARRASVKAMENLVAGFDGTFLVAIKKPAEGGRANRAVEEALAEYFAVSLSCVRIVAGGASRRKVVLVTR